MLHNTGQYVPSEVSVSGQTNSTPGQTQSESSDYNHYKGHDQQPHHSSMQEYCYDMNMAGMNQCPLVPKIEYSPNFMSRTLLQNCSNSRLQNSNTQLYNFNKTDVHNLYDSSMNSMLNIPNVTIKKTLKNTQYFNHAKLESSNESDSSKLDSQAGNYVDNLPMKSFDIAKYSINHLALSDNHYKSDINTLPSNSKPNDIMSNQGNILKDHLESQLGKHVSKDSEVIEVDDTIYPGHKNSDQKTNDGSFNLGVKTYKDQDSRKRSLEKTVQMIETIIFNSSSSRTHKLTDTKESLTSSKKTKYDDIIVNDTDEECLNKDYPIDHKDSIDSENENNKAIIESINFPEVNIKQEIKIERMEVEVDITPHEMDPVGNPFQNDAFGVGHEEVFNKNIYDAEYALRIAKELIKTGAITDSYFECPYCNTYFNNPKKFLIHIKWHSFGLTNAKRFELQREKEMKKIIKREAKEMVRMREVEENKNGVIHKCTICEKVFTTKVSLRNHRQRDHTAQSRECRICGKSVVGWRSMKTHMAIHTSNDGSFLCSECPKKFKHPHSLAKHRDTHKEKTHPCSQCSKLFGSEVLLNIHMKCHERTQRGISHHCTYCGKGFFESFSLQAHERTHRNERPFECDICNTRFGTNSSLKRHLKVSHSTSKPYECTVCHRSFISASIRDRHEERSHSNPEDFKFPCTECSGKYLRSKDLRKHMYKVHPKGRRKMKGSGSESDE